MDEVTRELRTYGDDGEWTEDELDDAEDEMRQAIEELDAATYYGGWFEDEPGEPTAEEIARAEQPIDDSDIPF